MTCDSYAIIYRGNLVDQGKISDTETAAAAVQIETTDNVAALTCLRSNEWPVQTAPGESGLAGSLIVEAIPGREWEVARDLAQEGIYPISMRRPWLAIREPAHWNRSTWPPWPTPVILKREPADAVHLETGPMGMVPIAPPRALPRPGGPGHRNSPVVAGGQGNAARGLAAAPGRVRLFWGGSGSAGISVSHTCNCSVVFHSRQRPAERRLPYPDSSRSLAGKRNCSQEPGSRHIAAGVSSPGPRSCRHFRRRFGP